jgi:hypothetical protein
MKNILGDVRSWIVGIILTYIIPLIIAMLNGWFKLVITKLGLPFCIIMLVIVTTSYAMLVSLTYRQFFGVKKEKEVLQKTEEFPETWVEFELKLNNQDQPIDKILHKKNIVWAKAVHYFKDTNTIIIFFECKKYVEDAVIDVIEVHTNKEITPTNLIKGKCGGTINISHNFDFKCGKYRITLKPNE